MNENGYYTLKNHINRQEATHYSDEQGIHRIYKILYGRIHENREC